MITLLESTALVLSMFILITMLGVGPVVACLPKTFRPYSLYIAPAVGYVLFCFFTIWISGVTGLSVLHSNWYAFFGLILWSIITIIIQRNDLAKIITEVKYLVLLLIISMLIIFIPALHQGVNLYLGTVNPDFYQSLSFHEVLTRFNIPFWMDRAEMTLQGPFLGHFPDAFQARFGGVTFSVLMEQLLPISPRASLVTSIIIFLSCLPPAVYFFCRTVLEFDHKTSLLSGVLIAISAPISMSFIHAFIGQNSALATFPLAISLIYITYRERSIKLAFLTGLILNGVFWLYVMALPYIIVPMGLFFLVSCVRLKRKDLVWLAMAILCLVGISLIIHGTVFSISVRFIKDLADLLGRVVPSIYYIDFLTEDLLIYANGLSSYPISQNILFYSISKIAGPIIIFLSFLILIIYAVAVKKWSKIASKNALTAFLCLLFTYLVVWFHYTINTRYGYASFKMISWLQFMFVPFFSWFIFYCIDKIHLKNADNFAKITAYTSLVLLIPGYLGLNLISDITYIQKSYGTERYHGSLINSYGIANNSDFQSLTNQIKAIVPKGSTVAVGFSDSIENFWAAYYLDLAGIHAQILSHEEIPFEDAYLPDINTRDYIDSLGNRQKDVQNFFNNGVADYYLLPGNKYLNEEIINLRLTTSPVWSNNSFALYKKENVKDLVVTGRGFYRLEYMDQSALDWWWPKAYRWSAEGGEIYHFYPSTEGASYRLQLSVIAGIGVASGIRTIEFWHNGKKFDEKIVNGSARLITKPYSATIGPNRIVIRTKEKASLSPRDIGLWNRDLPQSARQMNILVSDINIFEDIHPAGASLKIGEVVKAKSFFNSLEAFNGFDVNGWVRDQAELVIAPPLTAKSIKLSFLVPGNLGFKFPYQARLSLNGRLHQIEFPSPGEHMVMFDLPKASEQLKIKIDPSRSKRIADGIKQREVVQSIRLSSIEFLTKSK